mmetsp:Transcript_154391/g.495071  ORF Transcript_154391/g.495071 Transcript_154391/m.495071 type:complete len:365 (+) Transcript_154391:738-1832(+)
MCLPCAAASRWRRSEGGSVGAPAGGGPPSGHHWFHRWQAQLRDRVEVLEVPQVSEEVVHIHLRAIVQTVVPHLRHLPGPPQAPAHAGAAQRRLQPSGRRLPLPIPPLLRQHHALGPQGLARLEAPPERLDEHEAPHLPRRQSLATPLQAQARTPSLAEHGAPPRLKSRGLPLPGALGPWQFEGRRTGDRAVRRRPRRERLQLRAAESQEGSPEGAPPAQRQQRLLPRETRGAAPGRARGRGRRGGAHPGLPGALLTSVGHQECGAIGDQGLAMHGEGAHLATASERGGAEAVPARRGGGPEPEGAAAPGAQDVERHSAFPRRRCQEAAEAWTSRWRNDVVLLLAVAFGGTAHVDEAEQATIQQP